MMKSDLPFEKPIIELQEKLEELRKFSETQDIDVTGEVKRMEEKINATRQQVYDYLTPWQKVQVARHPNRPYPFDLIKRITTDFVELHGDRNYADDRAIIGGFAKFEGRNVMLVFNQKGRDTKSNLACNFGCAYPEGYRKALRQMQIAEKYKMPILTFIDTPGAYPGIESEERHIAEAIAVNLREMFTFTVPIIVTVTGEGGSGGALGIGIGNKVYIFQNSYYSVISPEGCAAILWKDRAYADKAAEALKLTAQDLRNYDLADTIIEEPEGGAHADWDAMAENLRYQLTQSLSELSELSPDELRQQRYEKFRKMGNYRVAGDEQTATAEQASESECGE